MSRAKMAKGVGYSSRLQLSTCFGQQNFDVLYELLLFFIYSCMPNLWHLIGYINIQTGNLMPILWEEVTYTMHCHTLFAFFFNIASVNVDVMINKREVKGM